MYGESRGGGVKGDAIPRVNLPPPSHIVAEGRLVRI